MNYFKYYGVNPRATLDDAMAPLRHHSIRYVSADQFNDPYDCKCFFEKEDGEREDAFSEVINRHLRVACMSRNPSSPIMWSHYSSHHAGYVIEYEMQDGARKEVEYKEIEPFFYSTKKIKESILHSNPSISEEEIEPQIKKLLLSDDFYMKNLMDAIFTKHSDWKYEKEHRFIDFNEKGSSEKYIDKDIGAKQVNSIILGYRFNHEKYDAKLKQIIDGVYGGDLTVYKAEPSLNEYRMKIKPYQLELSTYNKAKQSDSAICHFLCKTYTKIAKSLRSCWRRYVCKLERRNR